MATVNYPKRTIRDVPRDELLAAYAAWKMGADVVDLAKTLDVNDWSLEKSFEFRKRLGALGALEEFEVNLQGTRKSTP
jgi:hypothetical protein